MKKYRSLLVTLGVIVAAILVLVVIGFNLHNAFLFFPVSTISDDSGGAIIAWQNNKGIYVQHIDSSGKVLWQKGGLSVTNTGMIIGSLVIMQTGFTIVSDRFFPLRPMRQGQAVWLCRTHRRPRLCRHHEPKEYLQCHVMNLICAANVCLK